MNLIGEFINKNEMILKKVNNFDLFCKTLAPIGYFFSFLVKKNGKIGNTLSITDFDNLVIGVRIKARATFCYYLSCLKKMMLASTVTQK
jgi:hypothetical protein